MGKRESPALRKAAGRQERISRWLSHVAAKTNQMAYIGIDIDVLECGLFKGAR
jgi:hypothetical protein